MVGMALYKLDVYQDGPTLERGPDVTEAFTDAGPATGAEQRAVNWATDRMTGEPSTAVGYLYAPGDDGRGGDRYIAQLEGRALVQDTARREQRAG